MAAFSAEYSIGIWIVIAMSFTSGLLLLNWMVTLYQLWSKHKLRAINLRRPQSLLLFGFVCLTALLFVNPMNLYFALDAVLYNKTKPIQYFLVHISTMSMNYFLVYRAWFVYYNIKCNQSLEDEEWRSHIDTEKLNISWHIKNRSTCGNPKYVATFLFSIWLIFCVLGTLLVIISTDKMSAIPMTLSLMFSLVLLIVITCKMPKYDDYYNLRKECQMISICSISLIILAIIWTLLLNAQIGHWSWILFNSLHCCEINVFAILTFFWVFKQFKLPSFICNVSQYEHTLNLEKYVDHDHDLHNVSVRSGAGSISSAKSNSKPTKKMGLKPFFDVLKDDELIHLFAKHLLKEFSIENILFLIETHQFIQCIINQIDIDKKSNILNNIKYASIIPESTIVKQLKQSQESTSLNDVYTASAKLILKYIDYDESYFTINISSETREITNDVFGLMTIQSNKQSGKSKSEQINEFMSKKNITVQQIYNVFHLSRMEIFGLCKHTLSRFEYNP
eukprot:289877_1